MDRRIFDCLWRGGRAFDVAARFGVAHAGRWHFARYDLCRWRTDLVFRGGSHGWQCDGLGLYQNRSVSRRHAKVIRANNEYHVLEEVGTVNGTYVNDVRIPTGVPVTLHNGDLLKIGLISMKTVFD